MRDLFAMWRDSRMIVLTIVVTAIYTAFLIPLKEFVLVPGFTELRLANVFPVVFSLLFGPAAAWGAAFGNLIGDVFGGTLTAGSAFGFVGNLLFGYVAYRLWGNLGRLSSGEEPNMRSIRQLVEFWAVSLVAAAVTGAVIGWGLDLLGLLPFPVLATIIFVNDFVVAAVLGPPLLYLLYPRVERIGLLYPDLMPESVLPAVEERRQRRAATGIALVSVVWLVAGVAITVLTQGLALDAILDPTAATAGSTEQALLGVVALGLVVLFGAASGERLSGMVRGREITKPS